MSILAFLKRLRRPTSAQEASAPPEDAAARRIRNWLSVMYPDKVVPYGVYTVCANELGIDPTYVSIVGHRAGYAIRRKPSSKFHKAEAAA